MYQKNYVFCSLQSVAHDLILLLLTNEPVVFSAFELQFIVHVFLHNFVCSGTNNSFHAFEAPTNFVWAISTTGIRETFLIQKQVLIILICNPLESRYYRSTEGGTKVLPRLYVKLKFVSLKPSSPGMVFKFDMHVLGINARAFKNYLFHFILLK